MGSYSIGMQYLSSLGAVILMWDSPYYEFYYHLLEEGVHFLRVNSSSLCRTINWLRDNDKQARKIAENLNKWVRMNLSEKQIRAYYEDLFNKYSKLQHFDPGNISLSRFCK